MARPPVRNTNDKVREKTVAIGRGGTRFEDMSDKEAMHRFARENKDILEAQSKEIDVAREAAEAKKAEALDVEINDSFSNKIKPMQPPTLEEQREFLRKKHQAALYQQNKAYKEESDDHKEEQTTIHDILMPQNNAPEWMDEEAKIILASLPGVKTLSFEQQKIVLDRIPADQRKNILHQAGKQSFSPSTAPNPGKVVSNITNENGLTDAPPISPSQMRRKIEQEIAEKYKNNEPLLPQEKPAPRFVIRSIQPKDEDYQAFNPVSGFVFYDFDHCFVRKFNIADADNLHMAKMNGSLADIVHAVGATIKIDGFSVLDMSYQDLRNLFYWHQFNSFPKTPMEVEWTSKYGNKNYYRITDRTLKYNVPTISKEQYQHEWRSQGLTVPTVRDWLFYQTEELTVEEEFLCDKAQWFVGNKDDASFQSKIDSMTHYCSNNLDAFSAIPEFTRICQHGIVETIDVVDAKFNPTAYLDILEKELSLLYKDREQLENNNEFDFVENEASDERIIELNEVIMDIKDRLERKEVVEADVETRPINMSILDFFPGV